jgi:2-oxoglutarate ferredoxin oxidoreductase subunit alpha
MRNPETLARPWAIPGTPGLEHRIGGIEKEDGTGNVSYMPANHARMTRLRAEKLERIAQDIAPVEVDGADRGKLLVVGWGGTCGALTAAVEQARDNGCEVSQVHLRHLNPFPANLGEVLSRFERILVPELNTGQLSRLLRAEYLAPCESLCKIEGQPFKVAEVRERIEEIVS